MLGMDVTRRGETRLDHEHLARMKAAGTPLADAVARLTEIYWGYAEPRMWCIHDVVAVAYAARRDLVKTQPARVEIETRGRHTAGFTLVTRDPQKSNALVGMEIDQRLRELFMESMCRA
jgi:inosine-uridine nucleoside N-ribohydrolase